MMKKTIRTNIATGKAKCRLCSMLIPAGSKELLYWSGTGKDKCHAHLKCMFRYVAQELRTRKVQ